MLVIAAALANPAVLHPAPHVPTVQLEQSVLISPTVVSFTELEAGTPLVFNRRGSIGVAVSGWVQGYHLAVPAEKRSHTALRTAGLAAWVLFEPNTRIWHAVGLSGHLAPTQGGVFALVIQDTVSGGTISYRLNATGKRVDVGLAVNLGLNAYTLLHGSLLPSVTVHLGPVDLEASVVGGIQPLVAASLGARIEPVQGLDIGLTAYGVVPVESRVHVMPQLVVRYRGKWAKPAPPPDWNDVLR